MQGRDRLRGLRFAEPLESEFAARHALAAAGAGGPAALLGALLVVIWALLDFRLRVGEFAQPAIWIKLGVIVPALAAVLIVHVRKASGRATRRVAVAAGAALTVAFVALLFTTLRADFTGVAVATGVLTCWLYLLSGLGLLHAIVPALTLMVAAQWAASIAGVPAFEAASIGAFLLVTNAVCGVAVYRFEHAARSTFLEREVSAILSGNDAATGIPNRLALEHRYQLVARQAARESRSIALLIAEIDGAARALGSGTAAGDFRRVAHTILQSVRRPLDLAARIDGERFGVLLYDVESEHLPHVMRLIRENVALLDIEQADEHGPRVLTLTIGAALAGPGAPRDLAALTTVAELALTEAKDPENHGIAIRAVAPSAGGEAVTTGPWPTLEERAGV